MADKQNLIVTEKNIEKYVGQLADTSVVEQVKIIVDDFVQSGSIADSYYLLRKLEGLTGRGRLPQELMDKYRALILRLRFTAFPMLENPEQKELLTKYLTFALRDEWLDVQNRVHLVFYPYFRGREDREKLNLFLKAVESNSELIGSQPLAINQGQSSQPTIGNWVSNYKAFSREEKSSSMALASYLAINKSAQALSGEDRALLQAVLSFYNWLRYRAVPRDVLLGDFGGTATSPGPVIKKAEQPMAMREVVVPKESKELPPPPRPSPSSSAEAVEDRQVPERAVPKAPSAPLKPSQPPSSVRPKRTPSPARGEGTVDEDLYKSTLEELRKMREEYESGKGKSKKEEVKSQDVSGRRGAYPPAPDAKREPKPAATPSTDFSVNEAIARGQHGDTEHGEVYAKPEDKQQASQKKAPKKEDKKPPHVTPKPAPAEAKAEDQPKRPVKPPEPKAGVQEKKKQQQKPQQPQRPVDDIKQYQKPKPSPAAPRLATKPEDKAKPEPKPAAPPRADLQKPPKPTAPDAGASSAAPAISSQDELKRVSVDDMRRAESVQSFLSGIKAGIEKANISPEQAVTAFEQSPLHKAYVQAGNEMMSGGKSETMTNDEFEAIAEFRAGLQAL